MFLINIIFVIFIFVPIITSIFVKNSYQLSNEYTNKRCTFTSNNFIGIYKPITYNCTTLPPGIYTDKITQIINGETKKYFCCPEIRVSEQACNANNYPEKESMGSTIAVDGEIPYIAAVYRQQITKEGEDPIKFNFVCGSSIISEWYLLSAAHCFMDIDDNNYFVTFGKNDIGNITDDDLNAVDNVFVHSNYGPMTKQNDIALIKTEKKIKFSAFLISPICLHSYKMNNGIFDDKQITVSGWGRWTNNSGELSQVLRHAELGYVNQTYHSRRYPVPIIESQLYLYGGGNDACAGDGGGPARIVFHERSVVVGIISYGVGCGSSMPGVYTRVVSYIDWIESIVWLS